jgi:hypothetical protein
MYPVVIGNGRCLQSDAVVYGYHVPKGVSIEHALCEGFFLLDYQISNGKNYKILKIKMAIEFKMAAKLKSQIAA